jgi:hypothetical protein
VVLEEQEVVVLVEQEVVYLDR